jgi:hypothetical protein
VKLNQNTINISASICYFLRKACYNLCVYKDVWAVWMCTAAICLGHLLWVFSRVLKRQGLLAAGHAIENSLVSEFLGCVRDAKVPSENYFPSVWPRHTWLFLLLSWWASPSSVCKSTQLPRGGVVSCCKESLIVPRLSISLGCGPSQCFLNYYAHWRIKDGD